MYTDIRNIGILAHVDAGKTTITENFLYKAGAIKKIGNVDNGTTVTDSLKIERQRGISVKAACTSFIYKSTLINLIDTPGHIDFSAEIERTLRIMDGAILVISAADGIQAHTYTLWEALKEFQIPTLIFINKTDRPGSDVEKIFNDLESELNIKTFPMDMVFNEGLSDSYSATIWNENYSNKLCERGLESLADLDENILEMYLEGNKIPFPTILDNLASKCLQSQISPVFSGVAKNGIGINELLDGVLNFLPTPTLFPTNELSALVFKIEYDKTLGKLAHIRVFNGKISVRDVILNQSLANTEKVAQIRKLKGEKHSDLKELHSGDIGIVSGLTSAIPGHILGVKDFVPELKTIHKSVLSVQVTAQEEKDYAALAEALSILNSEDPNLELKWYKEERELHLSLMGAIQEQILKSLLVERFNIDAEFSKPAVIYKETPLKAAEGFVRYWMPKPCWAIMRFLIEPGEVGSGVIFESKVGVNDIHQKYQNEVKQTIPFALEQGLKGWEVTDLKITLINGEDHVMHSRPGDFILATPMGIMNGLKNSDTKLLEPIYRFEIKAPENTLGQISSQLTTRRAIFENPEFVHEQFHLSGEIPVATAQDLSIRIHSITGGKGMLKLNFFKYSECPEGEGVEKPYRGINPLDESQWILHQRGAFKANERKI